MTGADVVACARGFLGVPFRHQGRTTKCLDCAGLVILVAQRMGVLSPEFKVTGYVREPDGVTIMSNCGARLVRVERKTMQPGDIIVVAWEKLPQHLGIIGDYKNGGLSMIHAIKGATPLPRQKKHAQRGVTETRLLLGEHMRFVAAFRLPGI